VQAAADDLLLIFPYVLVQAKVNRLLQNIKFIKTFDFLEL
jgi:hypothetical protein